MPPKSIALIPAFGYPNPGAYSYKSYIWLTMVSLERNIQIQHAKNSLKEKRIGKYKIDGWHEESGTVFEFHGCVFHGCPKCYSPTTFNTLTNELMSSTYLKHTQRIDKIRQEPVVNAIVQIW